MRSDARLWGARFRTPPDPALLRLSRANDAGHLAGMLAIDDAAGGGPKDDVEFNVTLFKAFGPGR